MPYESAALQRDTIVTTARAPIHGGISSVTRTLEIGMQNGSPDYTFSSIIDIAVRDDGAVVVLEASSIMAPRRPSVRLYDVQGRFVTSMGRHGEGPGEHFAPAALALLPDGRVLVLDRVKGRINVFTRTGQHDATWAVAHFNVTTGVGGRMRVDSVGTISVRFNLPAVRVNPDSTLRREAVVRIRPGGGVIDTLRAPLLPDPAPQLVFTRREEGTGRLTSTVIVQAPYSPKALWQWSPQGYFLTAITNRYAIDRRVLAAGSPLRPGAQSQSGPRYDVHSLRLQASPVAISPAELRDRSAFLSRTMDAMQGEARGELGEIPRVKPFLNWIYVANDRRLWVSVHVESERYSPAPRSPRMPVTGAIIGPPREQIPWREPPVCDVFEPDGRYVGRVRLPYGFEPMVFQGDEMWGIFRDDLDVEYVHRYRVQWNR